ncbi:MAG TPA: lipid-A-disaccharide synthase [Lentisphaeria bacterium]|nr:MAG: lipid-A-disaccharide synthase [Lentisphaerae bacterium GWF2_49_21]HBC85377.1 lipid-A-disaccharide synthase [Lentisphaeria bacterium]
MMKDTYSVWIFAGEASGDIYGARLAEELRKMLPPEKLRIAGMGGHLMKDAGVEIMVDSTELGVVGLIEVFENIGTFVRIFQNLKNRAIKERPDAVILIDYPGFNLRFAKQMYKNKIPVIWYISPQVWAWGKGRIPKLAKYCAKMMVIFPFEPETYKNTSLDTEFVGHPLVNIVHKRKSPDMKQDPDLVLLLPGSRFNEINRLFVPMLETAVELHRRHPNLRFAVSAPRKAIYERTNEILRKFCEVRKDEKLPEVKIYSGETARFLQEAATGLAASGTITVESAIAGLPLVVVYRLNPITYWLGRMLVKIPFFTMVNLIAKKRVFEEFLQEDVNAMTLSGAMEKILPGGSRRAEVEKDIAGVVEALSPGSADASRKAAEAVMQKVRSFSS